MSAFRKNTVKRTFHPCVEALEQRDLMSTLAYTPPKPSKANMGSSIGIVRVGNAPTTTVSDKTLAPARPSAAMTSLSSAATTGAGDQPNGDGKLTIGMGLVRDKIGKDPFNPFTGQNDANPTNWNVGEQAKEGIRDWEKAGLFQSFTEPNLGRDLDAIGDRIARTSFNNFLDHIGKAPWDSSTSDLNPKNWSAEEFKQGVLDWQAAGLFHAPDQLARDVGDAARAARDAAQDAADAAGDFVDDAADTAGDAADDAADAADDAGDAAGDAADDAADATGDAADDAADAFGF